MQNLIVSLNENFLKVSAATVETFKSVSAQLDENVSKDSTILNTQVFSEVLFNLIQEATSESKDKKHTLHFLVEPQDAILNFITVNKKNGNLDEQIISEIRAKFASINLDDYYFSYQKIAPFVYQFIGVTKERMGKYLEVANTLGIELVSIIPWVMLLPRYIGKSDPSIFISKNNTDQIVALSELSGIYFCEVYEKEKSSEELSELVSKLSVYKRSAPITKVYTLADGSFSLNSEYEIVPLIPHTDVPEEMKGYEMHAVAFRVLSEDPTLLNTQLNMLTYLPLPVVEKKNTALVYVGSVAAILVILGGAYFLVSRGNFLKSAQQSNPGEVPVVLSESNETPEATPAQQEEKPVIDKATIIVKIENASGINGLASKTKDALVAKGYKDTNIEIGTAAVTRETTLVDVKVSKKNYLETVVEDIKDTYQAETSTNVDEAAAYDVLIQIGNE